MTRRVGRIVFAIVASANLAAPCRADDADSRAKLCRSASGLLAHAVTESGGTVTAAAADVMNISGHTVEVRPKIEQMEKAGHKTLIGVAFDVAIDGRSGELVFGTVGIGVGREAAMEIAVREWYGCAGQAIGAALAATPTALRLGPSSVHPGLTLARGEAPAGSLGTDEMHRSLLALVEPVLDEVLPPMTRTGFHSISLMVVVTRGEVTGGECRIDGAVNADVYRRVCRYPWPAGETYMVKQFYVLRTRTG
jgi:hypothetical protein